MLTLFASFEPLREADLLWNWQVLWDDLAASAPIQLQVDELEEVLPPANGFNAFGMSDRVSEVNDRPESSANEKRRVAPVSSRRHE